MRIVGTGTGSAVRRGCGTGGVVVLVGAGRGFGGLVRFGLTVRCGSSVGVGVPAGSAAGVGRFSFHRIGAGSSCGGAGVPVSVSAYAAPGRGGCVGVWRLIGSAVNTTPATATTATRPTATTCRTDTTRRSASTIVRLLFTSCRCCRRPCTGGGLVGG